MWITFNLEEEFRGSPGSSTTAPKENGWMVHALNYNVSLIASHYSRRPRHTQNTLVGLNILFSQGTRQDLPEIARGKRYIFVCCYHNLIAVSGNVEGWRFLFVDVEMTNQLFALLQSLWSGANRKNLSLTEAFYASCKEIMHYGFPNILYAL